MSPGESTIQPTMVYNLDERETPTKPNRGDPQVSTTIKHLASNIVNSTGQSSPTKKKEEKETNNLEYLAQTAQRCEATKEFTHQNPSPTPPLKPRDVFCMNPSTAPFLPLADRIKERLTSSKEGEDNTKVSLPQAANPSKRQRANKNHISIAQWNARSLNAKTKTDFVSALEADLTTIQEIWHQSDTIQSIWTNAEIQERKVERGGGCAFIISNPEAYTIKARHNLNKDSMLLKLSWRNNFIWIGNIYLHDGSLNALQKVLGKINALVPQQERPQLILIGDFNIDLLDKSTNEHKVLQKCCKELGLTIVRPEKPTRKGAILDFTALGNNVMHLTHAMVQPPIAPSDHAAIVWHLNIRLPKQPPTIKVPSRSFAEEITNTTLHNPEVENAALFLDELATYRQDRSDELWDKVTMKPQESILLTKLLEATAEDDVGSIINTHWRKHWQEVEKDRWSSSCKNAFSQLRKRLRYHLFESRDGGVIDRIKTEDGTILTSQPEINESLALTIKEIQIDERFPFLPEEPFPVLPKISTEEVATLVDKLSIGKALTLDGISDSLFRKENAKKAARVFRDLWSIQLDKLKGFAASLTARLVPLNKVFPDVPTRYQMRPIVIGSPIQKLLEARFLDKLTNYMNKNMFRGQTGFLKGMGIQVNLTRAIDRIRLRTDKNHACFGLFLDFANAYNSVPHSLLFNCLHRKNILTDEELNYLKCLYSRYRIRIGNEFVKVNKGVAQGSIISPALFNIFIEDLAININSELGVKVEDILLYADDILIICSSTAELRQVLKKVNGWTEENGMKLNKDKSAIVPFAPRHATEKSTPMMQYVLDKQKRSHQWKPAKRLFEEIPVRSEYKYLGTTLDFKLRLDPQLNKIRRKSAWTFAKLYPYLINATADARRDMWQLMIFPLFNAIFALASLETSATSIVEIFTLIRTTFRRFLMLPKRLDCDITMQMIGFNPCARINNICAEAREKWCVRMGQKQSETGREQPENHNALMGVPNTLIKIIRQQFSLCPKCRSTGNKLIMSTDHLYTHHKIDIPSYKEIWECIGAHYNRELQTLQKQKNIRQRKLNRKKLRAHWESQFEQVERHIQEEMEKL